MPVQNSNCKSSPRLELATNLLQILIPTISYILLWQQGQLTLQPCPRRVFLYLVITQKKVKIANSLQKLLPVSKGGFKETACPKDRQNRSWLSPCKVQTGVFSSIYLCHFSLFLYEPSSSVHELLQPVQAVLQPLDLLHARIVYCFNYAFKLRHQVLQNTLVKLKQQQNKAVNIIPLNSDITFYRMLS